MKSEEMIRAMLDHYRMMKKYAENDINAPINMINQGLTLLEWVLDEQAIESINFEVEVK